MSAYKTTPATNFTLLANDLINSDMPPTPQKILLYLLSKPVDDSYTTQDLDAIAKQIGLTTYAKKKALRWLTENGYLQFQRIKTGKTAWVLCEKSQQKVGA